MTKKLMDKNEQLKPENLKLINPINPSDDKLTTEIRSKTAEQPCRPYI